ncbi:MAG: DUF362 domain-containing protein [Desulfatibacillaceae bacterium]
MAGGKNRVMILEAGYDESMGRAVDEVFDAFSPEVSGKRVLVKPNILAPHPPEAGITTHPTLVAAVVRALKDRGAKVMVGDNPGVGGYGRAKEAADVTGIREAAGDSYVNLAENAVRVDLFSRWADSVAVSREVLDADLVVNLPKFKTHGLTFITGAIKNTFGYVVGGEKMRMHSSGATPARFAELVLDIYSLKPPELNVMDAVEGMEGNGPSNGSTRRIGKLLASDNAVCLDAVMVAMCGTRAANVPLVKQAGERGLGHVDPARIVTNVPVEPIPDFKLPKTYVPGLMGVVLNRFLSDKIRCVPEVIQEKCEKCGICVKHCPVDAMRVENGRVAPDLDECIRCYCCQEMCPNDAIRLSGRVISWLRRNAPGLEGRADR